jgi:hypothetical protein
MYGAHPNIRVTNNTWIVKDTNFREALLVEGNFNCRGVPRGVDPCPSNQGPSDGSYIFRDNIIAKGNTYNAIRTATPVEGADGGALSTKMWRWGPVTRREWSGNIIVGANITSFPSGTTFNLCPTTSSCSINYDYDDPVRGRLFENFGAKVFRVRAYARDGWDGQQIGARWDRLPLIMKPSTGGPGVDISKVGNQVTMTWKLNPDMSPISCSVHLATSFDMEQVTAVPPLPTSSNNKTSWQWQATLPSGTYYFELHCGSMERGEFTI